MFIFTYGTGDLARCSPSFLLCPYSRPPRSRTGAFHIQKDMTMTVWRMRTHIQHKHIHVWTARKHQLTNISFILRTYPFPFALVRSSMEFVCRLKDAQTVGAHILVLSAHWYGMRTTSGLVCTNPLLRDGPTQPTTDAMIIRCNQQHSCYVSFHFICLCVCSLVCETHTSTPLPTPPHHNTVPWLGHTRCYHSYNNTLYYNLTNFSNSTHFFGPPNHQLSPIIIIDI